MTRLAFVIAVALSFWLAGPSAARPATPSSKALTWDDCVSLAVQRSPDLASADYARKASEASYRQSFNGLLPGFTLTNTYQKSNTSIPGASTYGASFGADINLLSAGSIAGVKTSKAALAQARSNVSVASSNVRFNLRKAFLQVIFAQSSIDVSRAIEDLRRKDAELVSLRYQSGHEYKGNMMQFKAELQSAEADVRNARRDLRAAQMALDRQLGLDEFTVVSATGELSAAAPPSQPADFSPYLAGRPDVFLQQAAVQSAEAAVTQARSSFWPSLTANFSRGRIGPTEFPNAAYTWTYGGQLSYPLFSGGPTATFEAVTSARRGVDKARQDLRVTRDAALADLESAWSSYADAVDVLNAQEALLAAARQRNAEADVRYASGLLSFENWEVIVSERVSAERSILQALLTAADDQANWERAIGKQLGD